MSFRYEMIEFSQRNMNSFLHYLSFSKALKDHLKQGRSVNFEFFTSVPTMGAPTSVTRYVKTQSSAKNSTQQKWLHEALPSHPHPIGILGLMRILTMSELSLNYRNISILIE